jgi:hypothetical protein
MNMPLVATQAHEGAKVTHKPVVERIIKTESIMSFLRRIASFIHEGAEPKRLSRQLFAGLGAVAFCSLLCCPGRMLAQLTTADIVGTVTDATGAIVPIATVKIENLATHDVRTTTNGQSGDYVVNLLNPGSYSITVTAQGFKAYYSPSVSVVAGDRARVDAKLDVGTTTDTVRVEATGPTIETDSSVLTSTINNHATQNLPLDGRNYNLAQLTPGANEGPANGLTSGAHPDDRRQTSSISVNGQSDIVNNEMVDGLDNNERVIGTIGIRPSVEAIQEIRVQSNTYTAEVGRTAPNPLRPFYAQLPNVRQIGGYKSGGSSSYHSLQV